MDGFSDKAAFIWGIANLIRDTFKRGKYQDVILPFTVLRRPPRPLEEIKTLEGEILAILRAVTG